MEQPDAKLHFQISIIKSAFRICAGFSLCFGGIFVAGLLIIIAEVLGIMEELV